jgi:hypothetical protein
VRRAGIAALMLAALAAGAAAQSGAKPPKDPAPKDKAPQTKPAAPKPQPLPGEPLCGFCKTTGRIPFSRNAEFVLEDEVGPTWTTDFCSEALESDNMGLAWAPCPNCKTPSLKAAAQKEWDEHKLAGEAWLKERRRTDKVAGVEKPLNHVQTTHFLVVWNVPKITTREKKSYDAHAAAHLYCRRLEEFYARFQEMFGITDANNMKNLHTLMVFEEHDQAWQAGPAYTMLQGVPTVKRAGGSNHDSCVVTWWDKSTFPKEQDMWRHQLHNWTHQLTAIYYDMSWFEPGKMGLSPPWLNDKYGWLDEGLAHWFEIDFDRQARTYCMRETDTESHWGGDDWRKNLFKAVANEDIASFSDVSTKPSDALTAKENQFAWSWVDFLMARDRAAMGRALKDCKLIKPTRDILKEEWKLTVLDFETSWKTWVAESYVPMAGRR